MSKCTECGKGAKRNKDLCQTCTDNYWLSRPVDQRPWSWSRNFTVRRDGYVCQGCKRRAQNFNPNCLPLKNLKKELGRDLTNEEIALVLGIPVEELYTHLTVHHIIPRSEGGSHDLVNLVTLCRPCHDLEHGQMPKPRRPKRRRNPIESEGLFGGANQSDELRES